MSWTSWFFFKSCTIGNGYNVLPHNERIGTCRGVVVIVSNGYSSSCCSIFNFFRREVLHTCIYPLSYSVFGHDLVCFSLVYVLSLPHWPIGMTFWFVFPLVCHVYSDSIWSLFLFKHVNDWQFFIWSLLLICRV